MSNVEDEAVEEDEELGEPRGEADLGGAEDSLKLESLNIGSHYPSWKTFHKLR